MRIGSARLVALGAWAARRAFAITGAATIGGLALAAIAVRASPDTRDDVIDVAAGWLWLPVLLAVAAAVATTIEGQPTLGRDRADGDWIRRLGIGPLDGTGVGAGAALAVLALWLALGGAAFETVIRPGSGRPVREEVTFEADGASRADLANPRIELRAARPTVAAILELRPIAMLGPDGELPEPTVRVAIDGRDAGLHTLAAGGGLLRLTLDDRRRIERVSVTLEPAQPILLFLPDGAARALETTGVPAAVNAAAAALAAIPVAGLALAFALLGRRRLEPAVLQVGAFGIVLAGAAADWAPGPAATALYVRDLWSLGQPTVDGTFTVATAAAVLVVVAALPGARRAGGGVRGSREQAGRAPRRDPD